MTALNIADGSDVPNSIDSLEKGLVWLLSLADNLYAGQQYKETSGEVSSGLAPLVDLSVINAADGSKRLLGRVAIPIDPAYLTDVSAKFWAFADDWGNVAVPPAFKTD